MYNFDQKMPFFVRKLLKIGISYKTADPTPIPQNDHMPILQCRISDSLPMLMLTKMLKRGSHTNGASAATFWSPVILFCASGTLHYVIKSGESLLFLKDISNTKKNPTCSNILKKNFEVRFESKNNSALRNIF